ncbi:hypothetical protein P5V15_010186 [Pogonomyrmex californicus]
MTKESIFQFLNDHTTSRKKGLDFDDFSALDDKDYYKLTGLMKEQFNVVAQCVSEVRSTKGSERVCLALLLIKLRTGLSNTILSTLLSWKNEEPAEELQLQDQFSCLSLSLIISVLDHVSFMLIINEHTMSKTSKNSICKWRRNGECTDYSVDKGRNLVKSMMLVTITGYIVDVFDLYFADGKNNDASILDNLILKQNSKSCNILGLLLKCSFSSKGFTGFPQTKQNESRFITKIRWVNELIKMWKALRDVFPNNQILYIRNYVKIVCALCNTFRHSRNLSSFPELTKNPNDHLVAERMLELTLQTNKLQEPSWLLITKKSLSDFPRLILDESRHITFGVYQTFPMILSFGYSLFVHKQEENILRVQIHSHHTSSKVYNFGARVKCYAHIDSVLWYMDYSRYLDTYRPSREFESHLNNASCWSKEETEKKMEVSSADDTSSCDG